LKDWKPDNAKGVDLKQRLIRQHEEAQDIMNFGPDDTFSVGTKI
jgi:hypothetical protein